MTFRYFVDKAFWALLVASACYVGSQISGATTSINSLNEKMATVITQLSAQNEMAKDHESRLRTIESKIK